MREGCGHRRAGDAEEWSLSAGRTAGCGDPQALVTNTQCGAWHGYDAEALRDELQAFTLRVTRAANLQMEAEPGAHDDLVLALCLAVFYAQHEPEPVGAW